MPRFGRSCASWLSPALLAIMRGNVRRELQLIGTPGRGGDFVVIQENSLNAWSDGHYVAISTRMLRFAKDDAELAFIVAHEMAHNILNHAAPLRDTSTPLAEFGISSGKVR